ncbi:MAG: hypothetical protein WDW38_001729 [Sanguina aurantia]
MPRVVSGGGWPTLGNNSAALSDKSQTSSNVDPEPAEGAGGAIFEQYLNAVANSGTLRQDVRSDRVFDQGLARVREYLASSTADASSCLVCLAVLQPREAVWHCMDGCYEVMHLVCAQEWARSQLSAVEAKAALRLSPEQFPEAAREAKASAQWGCPKCRQPYPSAALPSSYLCYCGKLTNPEWDPWITPHSCGELCGRPLPGGCEHTCLLLCHPGPCPPCPLVIDARCHCGKQGMRMRCGHHTFSCEQECGRDLGCGHRCEEACHVGACPPCPVLGSYRCDCGRQLSERPCAERAFQCEGKCGKLLACGCHSCEKVCHAGACGTCPRDGERTCPCGKATYSQLSCTETAPPCGETCGRLLPCGIHTCTERCHTGDCSKNCRDTVARSCRCGKMQKAVRCGEELRCERRCTGVRACGRHPCKRRCCDGNCPLCEEVCGRRLKCGNHKCPAPCHSDPCRPCPLTVTVSCACDATHVTLPCGAESRATPPRCALQCPVPPLCRHAPQTPPHRCHFGPCPPCPRPCGTPQPCGHTCSSPACHDPPPPAVPGFAPPRAPAATLAVSGCQDAAVGERAAVAGSRRRVSRSAGLSASAGAAVAAVSLLGASAPGVAPSQCAPCQVPLAVECFGRHGKTELPCCSASPFSCSQPCGAQLACGNHSCRLPCHVTTPTPPPAISLASSDPIACQSCGLPCTKPRPCPHTCPLPCHPGDCPLCRVTTRQLCRCGKTAITRPCHELLACADTAPARPRGTTGAPAADAATPEAAGQRRADPLRCDKPCHRQLPDCPHPCRSTCHAGPCPEVSPCVEEVSVRCECKRVKRKWRCCQVQAALQAAGRGRAYDAGTQLRLLSCDESCRSAIAAGPLAARDASTDGPQQDDDAVVAATAAAVTGARHSLPAMLGVKAATRAVMQLAGLASWVGMPAPSLGRASPASTPGPSSAGSELTSGPQPDVMSGVGERSSRKLSRQERHALAEEKAVASEKVQAARALRELWGKVAYGLGCCLVVLLGVGLGLYGRKVLSFVDRSLRSRYAPPASVPAPHGREWM